MSDPTFPATSQTMAVAVSALKAQQARMRVIAENLANAESTASTPGGEPYQRQKPVFQTFKVEGAKGVRVATVRPDTTAFKMDFEPGNPAADAKGYVKRSNVDTLTEALDMREAQRAYDANLNVIDTAKAMDSSTLGIIKK
jgi:flagellar basal-body rod protein FlgC